jgi:hypothetical protein
MRNTYKMFAGTPDGKRLHGKYNLDGKIILKRIRV